MIRFGDTSRDGEVALRRCGGASGHGEVAARRRGGAGLCGSRRVSVRGGDRPAEVTAQLPAVRMILRRRGPVRANPP